MRKGFGDALWSFGVQNYDFIASYMSHRFSSAPAPAELL